jgi:hypothetical protein
MDLNVKGPRPLVLVANDVKVTGHLDLASHVWRTSPGDGKIGPGSDALDSCGAFQPPSLRGGGAGATFATPGLRGGGGGAGDPSSVGNGGSAPLPDFIALPPATLRAGCRGQTGGAGGQPGGAGGYGGGALYVVATQSIALGAAAIIDACGSGAVEPGIGAGGGGGGSGGMITLHAPTFSITSGAIIVANGGSGSTGGNSSTGGSRGTDPDPTTPEVPANGPNATAYGGDGFAQSDSAVIAATGGGSNSAMLCGGGGGGGAGGYIQSNMELTHARVSPAVSIVP